MKFDIKKESNNSNKDYLVKCRENYKSHLRDILFDERKKML